MADERRGNGRRFSRRRKNYGDRNAQAPVETASEGAAELPRSNVPVVDCALCHKPIFDLSSALADKESGEPVHFDCALQRVSEQETLDAGEKLVYIGSGNFAVVEFKDKTEMAFTIKRRVAFEEESKKQDWRRALSSRVSNL